MPEGTKVDKCYKRVKKSKGAGTAAAICQSSTGQSLKTGKPIVKKKAKPAKKKSAPKKSTTMKPARSRKKKY